MISLHKELICNAKGFFFQERSYRSPKTVRPDEYGNDENALLLRFAWYKVRLLVDE